MCIRDSTYIAYGSLDNGWWGEGEIKFFMDGDQQFPTIAGTGTEAVSYTHLK